jgi:CRISPR-associated protein Csm1
MSATIYEITIGALLHDIGKFLQRAFGSIDQLDWQIYDMRSTLCPKGKYQNYTHQHVLFTNAFFDLVQQSGLSLPQGCNHGASANIASFHHQPDASPDPAAAWICAVADRCSAGMDRKAGEEDDAPRGNRAAYRQVPLRCIFDEIVIDAQRPQPGKNGYRLGRLEPHDQAALLPAAWQDQDLEMPEKYRQLWEEFRDDFEKLVSVPELTFPLFEEALLGLLEQYTWAIPSSTIDLPDISLFDHLRTTAAIAAALYRYHQARGEEENVEAIKNEAKAKFRFLAGDLSGLQETLFTLENQGVRGVGKILRARSFLLGAIAESAALQVVEAFGLPLSSIVQQAGGRFLILVPALDKADAIIQGLRSRFDAWALEKYTGTLALNLCLSPPFSAGDFRQGPFAEIYAQVGAEVQKRKQTPLGTCRQGVLPREYPYERACAACGLRPAEMMRNEEYRCGTCQQEIEIGRCLPHAGLMAWCKAGDTGGNGCDVLGRRLILIREDESLPDKRGLISIKRIGPGMVRGPWAVRPLANYVPRFTALSDPVDRRYAAIRNEQPDADSLVKTFAHMAAEALEEREDGSFQGKPFLALLKADVDHLGAVFSIGLRHPEKPRDRFTLSRMAQLSRMIDLFFTGYLQGMIRRDFQDTYTIYAGGDDLLLIGPWRQMLDLAAAIARRFSDYTGANPNITLSAGLSLLSGNHPINRAVHKAETLLKRAKNMDWRTKNRIGAFDGITPQDWQSYQKALENAGWVHQQMQGKEGVSTGFVYHLLKLTDDALTAARGDVRKAGWLARLAYHLARNIKGKTQEESKAKRATWLQRLGFDSTLNPRGGSDALAQWRLPLTIALYRNRQ